MNLLIDNYIQNWLDQNPKASNLIAILTWMTNHPWWSLGIVFLFIVILAKIIKGLDKFLELTGLSVLKSIFNSIFKVFKWAIAILEKITGFIWKQLFPNNDTTTNESEIASGDTPPEPDLPEISQQHRLQEIKLRLEALHQEQNELLQEAAQLLANAPQDEVKV